MRLRRKKYRDPATRKLQEEGLLKLKRQKNKGATFRKIKEFGKITYDFWSGVKYIVFLSAILWWIPLFGPMLAGYVGGRRTGGPKKGLLASLVGLGIIGTIYYLLSNGYVYFALESLVEYPDKIIGLATSHSFFGPYLDFIQQYWTAFFQRLWAGVPFDSNSYLLTVIFAYIGGIISYERRKELTDGVRSLDRVKEELSSLHRYAKNPMHEQRSNAVNVGNNRLGDLRSVDYRGQSRSRREFSEPENREGSPDKRSRPRKEKRNGKKENARDNFVESMSNDEKPIQRNEVRHHSKSNGDDWEFL